MKKLLLTSMLIIALMISITFISAAPVVTPGAPTGNTMNTWGKWRQLTVTSHVAGAEMFVYKSGSNVPANPISGYVTSLDFGYGKYAALTPVTLSYDGANIIETAQALDSSGIPTLYTVGGGAPLAVSPLNYIQITVRKRTNAAYGAIPNIELRNVVLSYGGNSYPLGNFVTTGYNDWTVTGIDVTSGFTITGEIYSDETYAQLGETNAVYVRVGNKISAQTCGNNIKEGTEQCDGTDLGGATCSGLGTMACTTSCTLDTSGCYSCTGTDADNDQYSTSVDDAGKKCCKGQTENCMVGADCADNDADVHPEVTELCNGKDDNCNVQIDEGYAKGEACSDGVGDCFATGVQVCTAGGLGTVCNAVPGIAMPEVCDSLPFNDEDCDGTSNEDCSCNEGDTMQCGPTTDVGACEYGTQTCSLSGTWGDCLGAVYPAAFDIPGNGVDEDCNGVAICPIPCVEDLSTKDKECGTGVGGWRTHGQYVSCVAHYRNALVKAGIITEVGADEMVETAAQSDIGMKTSITGRAITESSGNGIFCRWFGWFC